MLHSKYFSLILLAMLLSSVLGMTQGNAFSQTTDQTPPNIFFTNVVVDTNPVPNKPFTVHADLQSQSVNWSDLVVYITAPDGMSVMSPIISNLGFTDKGNSVRASWTLMTSDTGSYPITITARSNFPPDKQVFSFNVNVGFPHSMTLNDIIVPGDIFPNDVFTVGIKLKNSVNVPDSNILAQITVPAGLQLLDDTAKSITTIGPDQEAVFKWNLKAENAGSFAIGFNYTSTNAGSNSASANVNVGTTPIVTGALLSIKTHPTTLKQNSINPMVFDITNNGIQDIHHLQIVSASDQAYVSTDTPSWIGDLDKDVTKTVTLQISTTNNTLPLQIPVTVKYDSNGNSFSETYQTAIQLENTPDFKIRAVTVNPPSSYAGDSSDRIDVQIFNAGMGADDVYANLNLPQGLSAAWGGATSAYFGRVDTFQTVTASFFVNIDNKALSGNYPLSMTVANGQEKTNMDLNFVVAPKSTFDFISADDSQLYAGATNVPLKITLKNSGTAAAQTITTKLLSGNSVPGVKSNTLTTVGNIENIGTILPGQTFTTTFLVNMDPTFTPGNQVTSVEIDWTQDGKNNFVQTMTVPYHVADGPSYLFYYSGISLTYVIIGMVLVVGLVVFIVARQKRMKIIEYVPSQIDNGKTDFVDYKEDISAIKINEPKRADMIFDSKNVLNAKSNETPDKNIFR